MLASRRSNVPVNMFNSNLRVSPGRLLTYHDAEDE
jgi:hypothetical protein